MRRCRWATRRHWKKPSRELLADENRRAELGRNALKVVAENLGAVDRTVEMILEHLKRARIYIAPKNNRGMFRRLTKRNRAFHIRHRFRFVIRKRRL